MQDLASILVFACIASSDSLSKIQNKMNIEDLDIFDVLDVLNYHVEIISQGLDADDDEDAQLTADRLYAQVLQEFSVKVTQMIESP